MISFKKISARRHDVYMNGEYIGNVSESGYTDVNVDDGCELTIEHMEKIIDQIIEIKMEIEQC